MSFFSRNRLVALQHRDFRLLWTGQLISTIGSQMQNIGVNWHVYRILQGETWQLEILGRSLDLDLGALGLGFGGLVRVLPIMIFALVGGVLADIIPRRRLIIVTDSAAALIACGLALVTFAGLDKIWVIYSLTALGAATTAMSTPARQSLVPNLVPRHHMTNAVSLISLLFQIGTIVGPGLGGLLVSRFDVGMVYAVNAISFIAVVTSLLFLRHRSGPAAAGRRLDWGMMREGLHFTINHKILWGTVLLDFFATLFASARTMLPIVAEEILGIGVEGYGLLATAQPLGAFIAGGIVALRKEIKHQGVVLLCGVAIYGLATAAFGFSTSFALSYILFAMTGAGDTVSTVIRGTIRQLVTPDHLRGRATSVSMVFFMGGPQLGEVEAGLVASVLGVPFAIISGGLATVAMTLWVAWRYPKLRQYRGEGSVDSR